jgi:hypothetical protein
MYKNIEELTLLLLYLTSWEDEDIPSDHKLRRSWKGYPFEVLNKLNDEKLIIGSKRAKSVYLTDEGIKQAKEVLKKYIDKEE